jgi:hypothetical protein
MVDRSGGCIPLSKRLYSVPVGARISREEVSATCKFEE